MSLTKEEQAERRRERAANAIERLERSLRWTDITPRSMTPTSAGNVVVTLTSYQADLLAQALGDG